MNSHEAIVRLEEGNARWVSGLRSIESIATPSQRASLAGGQNPFAVVLSCSDSRAPSEMIFDQGLGDLFVVRVAGNVVAPSLVGSIEYAVHTFGTELVVVMGHTACGAVIATLDAIDHGTDGTSENVLDIVRRIRPSVEPIAKGGDRTHRVGLATRANVRASVKELARASALLSERVAAGKLAIVGGEYDLASGKVEFFEPPRRAAAASPRAGEVAAVPR